jgi:hypothetical protein
MSLRLAVGEVPPLLARDPPPQAATASAVAPAQAREVADSLVRSVIADKYAAVYAWMEQAFRDAISEKEFRPALERLYEPYGKPLDAEYKMQEEGYRLYENGMRKPLRKFWYAVRTTEQPKGKCFLFVEVVPDGKALAAAAVQIVTFAGDPPTALK